MINALTGNGQKMTVEEADSIANVLFERIKTQAMEEKYNEIKVANETFLKENEKNDSIKTEQVTVTLPNGNKLDSYFQYKVLKEGNGVIPTDSNQAIVNYAGRLIDGTEFDNSYKREQPLTVNMKGGVIPGWIEVLKRMPAGSIWEVYIPQELAYGSREMGNIPPFSTLIFKMELQEVK
ncbi:MAG: FKBP-type peptidyl-prolyl cis-trans isomerase, partial [Prevotella sp.]|nr:FKBP-type peptidyl-prolyl cis-trans isomerase [Prevotella sp.]